MSNLSPSAEQIKIFRSLFSGRDDAYGVMGSGGPLCIREPLTEETLLKHFSGETRIGQYGLLKDSTVQWACIDVDTMVRDKVERVIVSCIESGIFPNAEASKGKGYHVWIFFDEPVKAKAVRRVLSKVLKDAGAEDCELFPKQDRLTSDNGLGNFVFLPLQGASVKQAATIFLDGQLKPYGDQWGHLSKIHRTKSENILSLAEQIPEESKPEPVKLIDLPNGSLDVTKYLIGHNIPFKEKKEPTRTIYGLSKCLFSEGHTTKDNQGDSAIIQDTSGKLGYQCFHHHCQKKTWADARKKISGDAPLSQFLKGHQETKAKRDFGTPQSLIEIIESPSMEEEPFIERLIFRGDKGYVVATYKLGKTLFLMQMSLCLSMGIPFLGLDVPKPRKVFYLRFELKHARFRERFNRMLSALGGPGKVQTMPYFHLVRGFDIKNEGDFSWLIKTIYEYEPEILIMDPLYKISLSTDFRKDDGSGIIRRFDTLRSKFDNLHIAIAHHPRKSAAGMPDNSWDSSYGPMQLFADMDYEVKLTRKGNLKDTFEFSHISNDVPIENFTFRRNPISLLYEIETPEDIQSRWEIDYSKILKQVQTGLKNKGNLTTFLQTVLNYKQREAKDCLEYLLQAQKLQWKGPPTRGHFEGPEAEDNTIQKEMIYE